MSKIIYRNLCKEDYSIIKNMICDAFGFRDFIKDEDFLDSILNIYLHKCILSSSYGQIAEKNNKVIGVILGKAKKDKNKLWSFNNLTNIISSFTKIAFSNKSNKAALKEFSKIQDIYKELIINKKNEFQGSIELFIVSEESRGLGVGKALMNNLLSYMKTNYVNSLYLYTDTRCNYRFYDSQGFIRIGEKKIFIDSANESLNVFLYKYKLI